MTIYLSEFILILLAALAGLLIGYGLSTLRTSRLLASEAGFGLLRRYHNTEDVEALRAELQEVEAQSKQQQGRIAQLRRANAHAQQDIAKLTTREQELDVERSVKLQQIEAHRKALEEKTERLRKLDRQIRQTQADIDDHIQECEQLELLLETKRQALQHLTQDLHWHIVNEQLTREQMNTVAGTAKAARGLMEKANRAGASTSDAWREMSIYEAEIPGMTTDHKLILGRSGIATLGSLVDASSGDIRHALGNKASRNAIQGWRDYAHIVGKLAIAEEIHYE